MMDRKVIAIPCDCRAPEDTLQVEFDIAEDGTPDLTISIHLTTYLSFWERLAQAFRYLFCLDRSYDFDTTIIDEESAQKIKDVCSDYLEASKKLSGKKVAHLYQTNISLWDRIGDIVPEGHIAIQENRMT